MKLLIKLLAGLATLLILAVVILVTVIDPNDYKEAIQTQVKKTINRDLLINGDISWTFFPQLGFSSGEVELNNPAGFNRKNLLKIDSAAVGLAVLPLFKGEVQIGELTLNGLTLNLITKKDGTSNLDNMFPEKPVTSTKSTKEKQPETEKPKSFDAAKLQLAGINIENTQIEIQDLQADSTTKLDINHIHLGKVVPGKETDLSIVTDLLIAKMDGHIDLQGKLKIAPDFSSVQLNNLELKTAFTGTELPNGKISSSINTDLSYDLTSSKADLTRFILQLDKINLKGDLSVQTKDKTKIRFNLQGNTWDLTPYLTQSSEKQKENGNSSSNKNAAAEQEPDLTVLNNLDVKGKLVIAGVIAAELKIGEITTNIEINQGKAQVKPLSAQLYQGLLTLNASLEALKGTNSYQINSRLEGVKIYPLLVDAAKVDLLSGTTAFSFSGSGKGLTASKIKSGLTGSGYFKLVDGELYGINIPQELRILKAKLTGKPAPTEANIKKTDFASLTGDFSIKNGLVDNNKLLMLSPVMRLDGTGLADILKESLNYKLSITPLSKSDEQTEFKDLSGISIPLLIDGPFSAPKFHLDSKTALKKQFEEKAKAKLEKERQKLQEKSQQKLQDEGKKLENKLQKELGKLFG
ncbi:MAG: AsmA family protein [Psychromonas sp.]|nr:AsmA family protein [Psychromonas sp.]